MITQEFDLNLIPESEPVVVHVDQYDHGTGRFIINLYEGDSGYAPNGTVAIQGSKPDGHGFAYDATLEGNVVTADLTEQMSAVAGDTRAQIVVTETNGRTGTFVFIIRVQKSALPDDTDMSESDYQLIQKALEDSEAWAVGEVGGEPVGPDSPMYHNNSKYWAEKSEEYAQGGLKWKGSVAFANIPTTGMSYGDMYNITDDFTTDSRFDEGAGVNVKAGTNIAWSRNDKWDLLATGMEFPIPLPTTQGGTGNTDGYIRTGQKSGTTIGEQATAEGHDTTASGRYSHAEGDATSASGSWSHAEGYQTSAAQFYTHAEGNLTKAWSQCAHAEGYGTQAGKYVSGVPAGHYSHAEGNGTRAEGQGSHAEGLSNVASGIASHAEGQQNTASGRNTHVTGAQNMAGYAYQHVSGKYNDNKSDTLLEVGNGTDTTHRSNAFEVYANGDINVNGNIRINGSILPIGGGGVVSYNGRVGAVMPASGDYLAAQIADTDMQGTATNVHDALYGGGGIWTAAVSCLVGDTSVSITHGISNLALHPEEYAIDPRMATASGALIGCKKIEVVGSQVQVTFSSALTEAASIKLHITRV